MDTAAQQYRTIAQQLNELLDRLRGAVELGQNALTDAAATMYTIRPESEEE